MTIKTLKRHFCGQFCESPLECMFWHFMRKTKLEWGGCEAQKSIGRFRVDALVDCNGQSVVVELDGEQFHNKAKDQKRDAEIIHYVDAIIRIPFPAMWYYPNATFAALESWFDRFSIGRDVFTIHKNEIDRELFFDRQDSYASEGFDENFEVWDSGCVSALVGSAKAFTYGSGLSLISRQVRHGPKSNYLQDASGGKSLTGR